MRGPNATPRLCITSTRRMLNGGKRGEPLGSDGSRLEGILPLLYRTKSFF